MEPRQEFAEGKPRERKIQFLFRQRDFDWNRGSTLRKQSARAANPESGPHEFADLILKICCNMSLKKVKLMCIVIFPVRGTVSQKEDINER